MGDENTLPICLYAFQPAMLVVNNFACLVDHLISDLSFQYNSSRNASRVNVMLIVFFISLISFLVETETVFISTMFVLQ